MMIVVSAQVVQRMFELMVGGPGPLRNSCSFHTGSEPV